MSYVDRPKFSLILMHIRKTQMRMGAPKETLFHNGHRIAIYFKEMKYEEFVKMSKM